MNITNVTVSTTAEQTTANASYVLEYSQTNGTLLRVQATILDLDAPKSGNRQVIGTIYQEQDLVTCNLPKGRELAPFFTDFDSFLKTICESVSASEK